MKIMSLLYAFLCYFILVTDSSFGQGGTAHRLALLPFQSIGLDEITVLSAESLLRAEIKKLEVVEVISEKEVGQLLGEEPCTEIPCAVQIGTLLEADQVLLTKLITLGQKVIIEFTLIGVPNQEILLMDQLPAATVEDLDVTLKRVAVSIIRQESVEKTAEIDLITEKETETPRRRSSRKFFGFSFGYLYPQTGYDKTDRSFAMDFRVGAEINNYSIGMQMGARKGFAMNIFGSYLLTKKDFCPFLGGAFGFHWVSHDYYYSYENGYPLEIEKRGDGFELTAHGGLLAFHTYNIQIIANLAYSYTFNDFNDQAVVFTIGLNL